MNTNSDDHAHDEIDHRLDEALQHWGKQFTADESSLVAAKASAVDALRNESSLLKISSVSKHNSSSIWKVAVSVAATIAIFALGTWALMQQDNSSEIASEEINSAAILKAQSDSKKQQIILSRFRELFGRQLNFVSDIDDEVQISLESDQSLRTDGNFLVVELVLLSRSINAEVPDWNVEHRASVLARSEHRVESRDGSSPFVFSMWALPIEDDLISIDLHCRLPGQETIEVVSSELQRSGSANQIHTFTRAGVEYRLYQTGTRLETDSRSDLITMNLAVEVAR